MANLPGRVLKLENGEMCDCHPDTLAVVCIQGETDSWGYERMCMCVECKAEYDQQDVTQECDHCHEEAICSPWRDVYEGNYGPVKWHCDKCARIILKNEMDYEASFDE